MQLLINLFPRPVFPVNNKLCVSGLSKFLTNSIHFSFIEIIFCLGDIFNLYFSGSILSENILTLNVSKFSLPKFEILDLL